MDGTGSFFPSTRGPKRCRPWAEKGRDTRSGRASVNPIVTIPRSDSRPATDTRKPPERRRRGSTYTQTHTHPGVVTGIWRLGRDGIGEQNS